MTRCVSSGSILVCLFLAIIPIEGLAKTRLIPHITRIGGGFETTVVLENHDAFTQTYRLVPYDADGHAGPEVSGTVAGQSMVRLPASEIWNDTLSHLVILHSGDDPQVSVAYRVAAGPGSPAHVRETDDTSRRWILFPGDWSVVFDGFAAVNLGESNADIWVYQYDADGTLLHAKRAVSLLPPMGKGLYVIGAPSGSAFTDRSDSWFEITADEPLAVTALRGTPPDAVTGYLWQNAALEEDPVNQDAALERLHVTEIMYHPADFGAEFIELFNAHDQPLDLSGVAFTDGIDYVFPQGTTVGAGAYLVLTDSDVDFELAYPGVTALGVYDGRLSNGGETVTLRNAQGEVLLSITYDDEDPWPEDADGFGYSLVIDDLNGDPNDPSNWHVSEESGGSPGRAEP